ncbi:RusA family crossover junction endodeoxyribonuclease [Micromonospora sp. NBC_00362]|uniref:RusA family crossover junction endodeoxyribonuclease n=1 Tax=Micromonospora sp. NBC_00362 TaxID=2975975 RepID=UPI00224DB62C|nr:RusA family crossover junction endodeoxyribonuclease [Micromonospora sp. NBC_00362]MCX5119232.1 RusA family crossover junction endodeoxyribonuclease [Micromonospora sp. NBC_00362]
MTHPLPATADLTITVHGDPATQGSKQARPIYRGRGDAKVFTGKVAQVESNKEKHKSWREAVKTAALDAGTGTPIDGPIRAVVVFTLRKPDSAPKRRRTWPHRKPDIDKLLRSTFDALTDAGVWRDDSRVVDLRTRKVFPGEDELALHTPGVVIRLWHLDEPAAA